jgi:hypothetical protein
MPAAALPPPLAKRLVRAAWAIALFPVVFALLTSADLAPFFAAMSIFAPEVFAVLALPLLLFLLVRRAGRAPIERLGWQLASESDTGSRERRAAMAAGLGSLLALAVGSIDFGSLLGLLAAAGSLADLGLWLWVLSVFVPEIAVGAALLMTILLLARRLGRFAAGLLRRLSAR